MLRPEEERHHDKRGAVVWWLDERSTLVREFPYLQKSPDHSPLGETLNDILHWGIDRLVARTASPRGPHAPRTARTTPASPLLPKREDQEFDEADPARSTTPRRFNSFVTGRPSRKKKKNKN